MSASGKAQGSPVLVKDDVYLLNQWNSNGGYLDTRGYQKDFAETGNYLCVSTATASNRDAVSGTTWKVVIVKFTKAASAIKDLFDSNAYYRLTCQWQGEGKSLDIVNEGKNNQPILAKTGNYSGPYWKITKVGDNTYILTTKWQGPDKKLDCAQGPNQNRPIRNESEYSGSA